MRIYTMLLVVGLGLMAAGCTGARTVQCESDENCNLSPGGICRAAPTGNAWCAYPDSSCPSGSRWSDFDVGDGLGGICVGADESPDAGPSDSGPAGDALDTEGPTVVSTSPSAGQGNVGLAVSVRVTFSEPIDPASLTAASFVLERDGADVAGSLAADGDTITFAPSVPFALSTDYDARVTTDITDLSGNPLQGEHAWTFGTRAGAWGSPQLLATSGNDPDVGCSAAGHVVAGWEQGGDAWAAVYTPSAGWSNPERIEARAGDVSDIRVGVDDDGNATAAWVQETGSRTDAWTNRYEPGVGWGSAILLESSDGNTAWLRVAVNGTGNAVATWAQTDAAGANLDVYAAIYAPASGWGSPRRLEDVDGFPDPPFAVIDDQDTVTVGFGVADDQAIMNVWAARWSSGSGWTSPINIENADVNAGGVVLAVDGGGDVAANWGQVDDPVGHVWANAHVDGLGWSSPSLVDTDDSVSAGTHDLSSPSDGRFIGVWTKGDDIVASINANGSWGVPISITLADSNFARLPRIAGSGNGAAVAVWQGRDTSTGPVNLWANVYTEGDGWGLAEDGIEPFNTSIQAAEVCMDAAGRATVVLDMTNIQWVRFE